MSVQKSGHAKRLASNIRRTQIKAKGFADEPALVDDLAKNCRNQKTLMITGNYTVRQAPGMDEDDARLLGPNMLLTIDLCVRVSRRCSELGIELPSILLLPNDIAPGVFLDYREGQRFKAGYSIPPSISALLPADDSPILMFNRWFDEHESEVQSRMLRLRKQIKDGYEKLIVMFESFAQNLGAKKLSRGLFKPGDLGLALDGSQVISVPASIHDSFSGSLQSSADTEVRVTNPNGAPFCSFLAATLLFEFEQLGYTSTVGTWVSEEYPCVDKAAAAYRHIYAGKMSVRNIFLQGNEVLFDNTI